MYKGDIFLNDKRIMHFFLSLQNHLFICSIICIVSDLNRYGYYFTGNYKDTKYYKFM